SSLKRATTSANLSPRASSAPSNTCDTRSSVPDPLYAGLAARGHRAGSQIFEDVPELVALCLEIAVVLVLRRPLARDRFHDLEAMGGHADELLRVVGQDADPL